MFLNPAEIRLLIRAVTKRTGLPLHDEDLEQEAALNAIEAFRRLERIDHPRALLRKIVYDTVRDHWRRRPPSAEALSSVDERLLSHMPEFESHLDSLRRIERLRLALKELPAHTRSLLDLYYTRDLSIAEIADLQHRSPSAIKMELVRARQTLARMIRSLSTKKSR
jgi:RNA polymerase sigma factor (sigma-70 family)